MNEKYIKSCLNYVGGKYKLLGEILHLFPDDIDTFVDLFGGGFNVGINVMATHIVYNDMCKQVVDLLRNFYRHDYSYIHENIIDTITNYGLSRTDVDGYENYGCNSNDGVGRYNKTKYLKLREDYNNSPNWIKFYALITCAFNNQIRFNSKGEFNIPYGKRDYNVSLQKKLKIFVEELHKKDIQFLNMDFREYIFKKNDFIYCDPPYFSSVASYNENGGWTEKDETDLLNLLDRIDLQGNKFALSNNLKYHNPVLKKWKNKYHIHYLNGNYSNCNYQKKDKSADIEVLITNY